MDAMAGSASSTCRRGPESRVTGRLRAGHRPSAPLPDPGRRPVTCPSPSPRPCSSASVGNASWSPPTRGCPRCHRTSSGSSLMATPPRPMRRCGRRCWRAAPRLHRSMVRLHRNVVRGWRRGRVRVSPARGERPERRPLPRAGTPRRSDLIRDAGLFGQCSRRTRRRTTGSPTFVVAPACPIAPRDCSRTSPTAGLGDGPWASHQPPNPLVTMDMMGYVQFPFR